LIGVSSDVTRRKEAELEAEARAKQQEAVALFSRLALQTPPLDQLFQSATELITRTLGIKVAMILEKLGSESELAIVAGTGCIPADLGTRRVPSDATSLSGRAFESPKPVILDDFAAAPLASASLAREYGVTSGMAVGIGDRSRRFGVLTVLSSTPRHFNEDRTNFIQAIAFVLGAAVEQKAAEARLLLRDRALESIEQGILITDGRMPDQSIVYANPAFARITGYALDDLVGRNPHLLDGQYTDPNLIAQIRTAIREGGGFSGTLQKNRKDGSTFWTELTIAPVRDESGRITNFVGVHSDVTKKIALEADLRQAQKMEAVGQLTGGVAHDFNNLLTVILGNAEILADEVQQANLAPMATMIVDAAERGADLTRRLLAFGRRQTLRPELLSLDTIVDSMVGMLRRTIGEQIRLRTTLASGTQAAFIDRSLLETAILNLVVNARDAIEAAGTLTIGTREICIESDLATPDLPAGTYLVLTVADTGTGMSAEVRERAFEPFFTTKETGKGTGLGLPMVYGFAKQSGGHVRITSELGRGTNIELFLPAAQGEQRPASLAAAPGLAARAAGRECILVVEDQEEVRRFVVGQLGGLGYDVTSAGSSADALQLLRSRPDVALLFTDVVLADGSDGLQLADDARRLCPDLKVLFTSGYPEEVLKRRRFGEEPFLRKPYRRRELAEAVRGALDRR
jgi:PAS domain S-box-containing protein